MDSKNIEYKVIDDCLADIYTEINFSDIAKSFADENCTIFTMEERDESLEAFYLSLLGGSQND